MKVIETYIYNCILFSEIISKAYGTHNKETVGVITVFCLPYCRLSVSTHSGGPAVNHVDMSFPGFSLSLSKCWDTFQVAAAFFSYSPLHFEYLKITPLMWTSIYYWTFKIIISTLINNYIKIALSLSSSFHYLPLSFPPYHKDETGNLLIICSFCPLPK
jgi:hypothetical protein